MKHINLIVLSVIMTVSFAAQASATQSLTCKKESQSEVLAFHGELQEVTSTHPNGTTFKSIVLELYTKPFCFVEGDSSSETYVEVTKTAQLSLTNFDAEGRENIRKHLGETVTVTGNFYVAHTAWHIRPIVVQVNEILYAD